MVTPAQQKRDATLERRARVTALYLQGKWLSEIAGELKVDKSTITRDMKAVRKAWEESGVFNFHEALGRELAKLDTIEREAWEAYAKSKEPTKRTQRTHLEDGIKDSVSVTTRNGDPRYLQLALDCVRERTKLLGLVTEKMHHSGLLLTVDAKRLSDDQLAAIAAGGSAGAARPSRRKK